MAKGVKFEPTAGQLRWLAENYPCTKNAELCAALGVDPSARLEYCVARENEAFRLEAREARKSIDDEKRRVKETPVAEGDAQQIMESFQIL